VGRVRHFWIVAHPATIDRLLLPGSGRPKEKSYGTVDGLASRLELRETGSDLVMPGDRCWGRRAVRFGRLFRRAVVGGDLDREG
jgi:hypothetical protein